MIKLFDVVKYKTNVKGYWLNNEGKLFIDNIDIKNYIECRQYKNFIAYKKYMFKIKKQLAVFYIKGNKAYIENRQGNIDILSHCISWKEKHITKKYIKALLFQHKGLTIYKNENDYTIEIWKE